jgi:hypothetical protein
MARRYFQHIRDKAKDARALFVTEAIYIDETANWREVTAHEATTILGGKRAHYYVVKRCPEGYAVVSQKMTVACFTARPMEEDSRG